MAEETLRETLEAAYEEVGTDPTPSAAPEETGRSAQDASEPVRDTAPTEEPAAGAKPAVEPTGGKKRGPDGKFLKTETETQAETASPDQPEAAIEAKPEEPPPESRPSVRAPESWKPVAREHWAKLPAEVQQEVARREKEITQTLQQTAQQRKLAEHFTESVRPFEAMIRAENRDPVTAASELFATAAMLRMGSPVQKAQLVANMVKNFGIPIDALDAALVGEQIPDEDSKLARLIDQRLQPVNQFINEVQTLKQRRTETVSTEVQTEIEAFANDPANEFFADLRDTMADLMEVASKNGRRLTLRDAYDRAVLLTPDVKAVVDSRKAATVAKKKEASASLPQTPPPQGGTGKEAATLRADIENAFASVANR
jgi:flagellar biosynthesis/type III secretory pathway chaperone